MFSRLAADVSAPGQRTHHESALQVTGLYCYPVKSCAAVTVNESVLTAAGLEADRSFMVTDEDGRYRTQRNHPRLALVQPTVSADGTRLDLRSPITGVLRVRIDLTGRRRVVDLFGANYLGIDQGDEVADWLSDTLGVASRLMRVPPEHDRVTDGHTPGRSGYADSCPIHLLSESSHGELNRRLAAKRSPTLPMSRFRPNIVIAGGNPPHGEDTLRRIRIGQAELGYAKPAIRCAVTTVDQHRGTKCGPEPLTTLATYRRVADGGIAFGTKFAVTTPGTIAVGDTLAVTAQAKSSDDAIG